MAPRIKPKLKRVCLNCGKEFGILPCKLQNGGGKFHNKQCKDEFLKGENNPFFGKHHSEETKLLLKEKNSGENNTNFGTHRLQTTKDKISKTKTGKRPFISEAGRKRMADNGIKYLPMYQWLGKSQPVYLRMKKMETMIGGFWYGNIRYYEDGVLYCEKFTAILRERVRVFWKHRCVKCGKPQLEYLGKNGKPRKLSVHHVHYDKQTCCNGSPRDLVPLCCGCNVEVNTNRKYWEKFFTDLIYALNPDGKCFLTPEEWISYKKGDLKYENINQELEKRITEFKDTLKYS